MKERSSFTSYLSLNEVKGWLVIMKGKVIRKITAVFTVICMLLTLSAAVMAKTGEYAVSIDSIMTDTDGNVTGAAVTVTESGTYTLYAATYTDGTLCDVASKEFTASGSVTFDSSISYNEKSQSLRLYVWDENQKPAAKVKENTASGFTVTFSADEHVTITVSDTQSFDGTVYEDAAAATARDGSTGAISTDGTGQVNFMVTLDDGYEIAGVNSTDATFNKIKKVGANKYRITQITGDAAVAVTSDLVSNIETDDKYTAVFAADNNVTSIVVSETQEFDYEELLTTYSDEAVIYAREGDAGYITTTDGQINFVVNVADGYEIESVTATDGTYKNIKLPAETKITNGYRITKISADTVITVTTKEKTEEAATGTGTITYSGTAVTYDGDTGVTTDGTTATITKPGSYTVTGSLDEGVDGQLVVNYVPLVTENEDGTTTTTYAEITLDGAVISNSSGYAVNGLAGAFTLASKKNTESTLSSTSSDAVYSVDNIEIKGNGTLNVVSTAGNGIRSKENVEVGKGTLNVEAATNGIKGDEEVKLTKKCGTVTIVSGGDGITSDNAPTIKKPSRTGVVTINGGTINITTSTYTNKSGVTKNGDGIQADTLLTIANSPDITINAAGDAIKSNFSHLDLAAETSYADYKTMLAAGDGQIAITGGTVRAVSGEDGIKAVKSITVSETVITNDDGTQTTTVPDVTLTSAGDEGVQVSEILYSNEAETDVEDYVAGEINISGGKLTVTRSEGDGIQCGTGDVNISGGTVTVSSAGDEGIQAGKVEICTDSGTPSFTPLSGSVNISGGTVTTASDSDGITAVGTYKQTGAPVINVTAGSKFSSASCDGIQVGKAYTNYDVYGTGDDTKNIYETNGVVDIEGGTLNVTACGGAYDDINTSGDSNSTKKSFSCKGIKARKLIDISGGTIDVNSYDDAVHSNHTVNISGGEITAQSCDDGIHGEYYLNISGDADVNVTKSYEGIEASEIYVSGGETRVAAEDDGANAAGDEPGEDAYTLASVSSVTASSVTASSANVQLMAPGGGPGGQNGPGGSQGGDGPGGGTHDGPGESDSSSSYGYMEVSGGLLYIVAEGDGFDSNGSALIKGGTVLVNGPTKGGNGIFDVGENSCTLKITGGIVIGAGTSDMKLSSTSGTMNYYVYPTLSATKSAGTAIQVKDSSNNVIATYVPSKSYACVFVSTPAMTSGTYTVSYGGSVSGGTVTGDKSGIYGLVTGGTYTSGTASSASATAANSVLYEQMGGGMR